MSDQASALRELARQSAQRLAEGPRRVVVTTGSPDCDTTTPAIGMANALTAHCDVLLMDAADAGRLTLCWDAAGRPGLSDVAAARCELKEVTLPMGERLRAVPAGSPTPTHGFRRLKRQLQSIDAGWAVMDAGVAQCPELWLLAEDVVLVARTNQRGMMDAYAALKAAPPEVDARLWLLFLEFPPGREGSSSTSHPPPEQAAPRLQASCRQFLHRQLTLLGVLPCDSPESDSMNPTAFREIVDTSDAPQLFSELTARLAQGVAARASSQQKL